VTVVVYGRPGCHLCEKALAIVRHLQPEFGYRIEDRDITHDPALFVRYREEIPVIVMEGREIARGRVTIPAVRASFAQALAG
jgi:glutaredoxin